MFKYLSKCLDFSAMANTSSKYWKGEKREIAKTNQNKMFDFKESMTCEIAFNQSHSNTNIDSFYGLMPDSDNFFINSNLESQLHETLDLNPVYNKASIMNKEREPSVISDLNFAELEDDRKYDFKLDFDEILNTSNEEILNNKYNHSFYMESLKDYDLEVNPCKIVDQVIFPKSISCTDTMLDSTIDNTIKSQIIEKTSNKLSTLIKNSLQNNSMFKISKYNQQNSQAGLDEPQISLKTNFTNELQNFEFIESSEKSLRKNNININININNYAPPQLLKRKTKVPDKKIDEFGIDFRSMKTSALVRLVKFYQHDYEKLSKLFQNTTANQIENLYNTIMGFSSYKINLNSKADQTNFLQEQLNSSKNLLQKKHLIEAIYKTNNQSNNNLNLSNTNDNSASINNQNTSQRLQLVKSAVSCSASGLCSTACETKRYSVNEPRSDYPQIEYFCGKKKPQVNFGLNNDYYAGLNAINSEENLCEEKNFNLHEKNNADYEQIIYDDKFKKYEFNTPFKSLENDSEMKINDNYCIYDNPVNQADTQKGIVNVSKNNNSDKMLTPRNSNYDDLNEPRLRLLKSNSCSIREVIDSITEISNKLRDDYLPSLKNIDFQTLGFREISKIGKLNSFLNKSFELSNKSFQKINQMSPDNYSIFQKYPEIIKKTIETNNSLKSSVKNIGEKYFKYNKIILTSLTKTIDFFKKNLNETIRAHQDRGKLDYAHSNIESEETNKTFSNERSDLDEIMSLNLDQKKNLRDDDIKSTCSSNIFISTEDCNKNEVDYTEEKVQPIEIRTIFESPANEEIIYFNTSLLNQSLNNTTSCNTTEKSPSTKFSVSLSKKLDLLSQMVYLLKLKLIWFQKIENLKKTL